MWHNPRKLKVILLDFVGGENLIFVNIFIFSLEKTYGVGAVKNNCFSACLLLVSPAKGTNLPPE